MAAKNIRIFNFFTCRAIQNTIVIQSISGVLGNLPSFTYFRMQWPLDWWRHVTLKGSFASKYIWMQISRKLIEINAWFQRIINTKLHMANQMVTWLMTPICLAPSISKTAGHTDWLQWRIYRKLTPGDWGIKRSRVRWRHVTIKSQDRAHINLEADIEEFWRPNFSETVGDKGSVPKEHPWDGKSGIKWSRDRRRHNVMTLKSSWWSTYMWMQMSEKPLEIEA